MENEHKHCRMQRVSTSSRTDEVNCHLESTYVGFGGIFEGTVPSVAMFATAELYHNFGRIDLGIIMVDVSSFNLFRALREIS